MIAEPVAAALLAVTRGTQAHSYWVPPALLPESQMRHGNIYLLWHSIVQVSTDDNGKSTAGRKTPSRSQRRDDNEQIVFARPRIRRRGSPPPEAKGVPD